jgi:hypothetical protein
MEVAKTSISLTTPSETYRIRLRAARLPPKGQPCTVREYDTRHP